MMILAETMDTHLLGITKHLPMRAIKNDGEHYLERYYVGQNRRGEQTWLHRFLQAAGKESLHTHPWYADSVIICGGYTEESASLENFKRRHLQRFSPGEKNLINPETLHRITQVDKFTWTLMQVKPNWGTWHFIDDNGNKREMGKVHNENWWMDYKSRVDT